MSDEFIIIGVPGYNTVDKNNKGYAYVFQKQGAVWTEMQRLIASDGKDYDDFGSSVSISGDYLVVGSQSYINNGIKAGAAYVYFWNGEQWIEYQKLVPADGKHLNSFGYTVSIFGDQICVGAYNIEKQKGSIYIYEKRVHGLTDSPSPEVNTEKKDVDTSVSESVIGKIEDYRGKTLDWLRLELKNKFTSDEMIIREPVIYEYNNIVVRDIILEQFPAPGTPIYGNKVTYIDLIVSKGPRPPNPQAGHYIGKHYTEAIRMLTSENIPFIFELTTQEYNVGEGIVVKQEPEPGNELSQKNTGIKRLVPVRLIITPVITFKEDEVFGIFQYIVEKYPVPVELTLIARSEGEERKLFSMKHEGGKLSFPYIVKPGTEILVYVMGSEEDRYLIGGE